MDAPFAIAPGRAALIAGLAAALIGPTAGAAPAIGGVVARPPVELGPEAEAAFRAAAAEFSVGTAEAAPVDPARQQAIGAALSALQRGEQAYLEVELRTAERALRAAVDGLLADPTTLADAEPAQRAVLLLAQVFVAQRRPEAADEVLERAIGVLPGFPGDGVPPPPDVLARIEGARARVKADAGAVLRVTSEPAGRRVRVNGVPVGRTPVELDAVRTGTVRVMLATRGAVPRSRVVAIRGDRVDVHFADPATQAAALRASVRSGEADAGWAAAARLQTDAEADQVCVAVVDAERAVVARLDAATRSVRGGVSTAPPRDADGFAALGRYCGAQAPSDLAPAQVVDALWPADVSPAESGGGFGRTGWAYTALGTGAAVAGLGTFFGVRTLQKADDYNDGRLDDRDEVLAEARAADISFGVAAVLVGVGAYLLLTAPDDDETGQDH